MRSLFAAVLFSAALPSLIACSSDSREKASFSALSASDRQDMTESSTGSSQYSLVVFASLSISLPSLVCPSINIAGTTATISGNGCVDDDGNKWSGKMTAAVNSSGVSIDLDNLSISNTQDSSQAVTVDGEITAASGGATLKSDVSISYPDRKIQQEGGWTSLSSDGGSIAADSTVEIDGKGYVDTSGQWNTEARSGAIVMQGEETYRVDFTTYVKATGCAETTLDGTASGTVCLDAEASGLRASPLTFFTNAIQRASRR